MRKRKTFDDGNDESLPAYDITGPSLVKFRRIARGGLKTLTSEQRHAYGEAVEAAVLASQRSRLDRASGSEPRPTCASGTWHSDGDDIGNAVRQQQRAALGRCPSQERRARKPEIWASMYAEAMAARRVHKAA